MVLEVPPCIADRKSSGGSVTDRWAHCPLRAANKRATYRSRHSILGQLLPSVGKRSIYIAHRAMRVPLASAWRLHKTQHGRCHGAQ
jgi:hypothetical protein